MFSTIYLVGGAGSGLIIGFILFYSLFYRPLKKGNIEHEQRLAQLQAEQETLTNKLYNEGTQRQLEKQTFAKEKTELEANLAQFEETLSTLTGRYEALSAQSNENQQKQEQTIQALQEALAQAATEKSTLEDQLAREKAHGEKKKQDLEWENQQLQNDLDHTRREKAAYEKKSEERRDEWEQKRLDLDIQIAQAQNEIKKLEAKLAVLGHSRVGSAHQGNPQLDSQLKQLLAEKEIMAKELIAQTKHTQALEEEIEQLMDRLLRVQPNF